MDPPAATVALVPSPKLMLVEVMLPSASLVPEVEAVMLAGLTPVVGDNASLAAGGRFTVTLMVRENEPCWSQALTVMVWLPGARVMLVFMLADAC